MIKRPFAKKTGKMGAGPGGILSVARELKAYSQAALVSAKKAELVKRAFKNFTLAYEKIEFRPSKKGAAGKSDYDKLKKSAKVAADKLGELKTIMDKVQSCSISFENIAKGLNTVEEDAKKNKLTNGSELYNQFLGTR